LVPGAVDIGSPLIGAESSAKIQATSSSGSITATLSWSPTTIEPGNPTTFSFTFTDALRNKPLRDVSYEFMLVKDGQELTKRQGQTVGGTTSEQFSFSESQAGSVTLRLENLNNTGESVSFDIQVVPEFPLSALIIMAGLVATVLGLTKFKNILTVRREY